jgi:hypothetical protein
MSHTCVVIQLSMHTLQNVWPHAGSVVLVFGGSVMVIVCDPSAARTLVAPMRGERVDVLYPSSSCSVA